MTKKYRLNSSLNFGAPDAETDDLLFEVFVENNAVTEVLDTRSQKSILLGRTGSGKSAIIRYLENQHEDVQRIEPEALSLQFLSNSTILKYFRGLGINLNLFYKVLWKHVFIVELLKLYFKDDFDQGKKHRWLSTIREALERKMGRMDPKKEKALDYLDKWTDKFWMETEYRVKELEQSVSQRFASGIGIKGTLGYSTLDLEKNIGERSKTDITHKAESVIHEVQSKELIEIFNIMKTDLFTDHQKKFYIVIDDLDKEWIEASFRYDLIGAMIEVIKEFRQFKGVKIIISLRENLNELLNLGSKHQGGQREKFRPLYGSIKWTEEDLKELIDRRLSIITQNQLNIRNAFYSSRRSHSTGIKFYSSPPISLLNEEGVLGVRAVVYA